MLRGWWCLLGVLATTSACYSVSPSKGGGQIRVERPPPKDAGDVAVPEGYRVALVAEGLTFPTGVAFDADGRPHVVEAGYSYGEKITTPRLLRVEADGRTAVVASGKKNGPWNGVTFADGAFFVAAGGELEGGRILRIGLDGGIKVLVAGLPSLGDHHTNGPVVGADGFVYFGQGTATNSAVVGTDNFEFGWLRRHPDFHDTPCKDIVLAGVNYLSTSPLPGLPGAVATGAYSPYGEPTTKGQVVSGALPCNGAVMRVPKDGGDVELVAWGFRNPFGLAFAPDGRLFVTENGFDERGSRHVATWPVRSAS